MLPSDTDYETKVTLETNSSALPEDPPFHLLFLGDWSGKESELHNSDLSALRPIEIDRDNFDEVLSKLGVKVSLSFSSDNENALSLNFAALDDFHPDNIFQKLPLFSDLRDIRQRLSNSNTYNQAACEVRSWYSRVDNDEEIGHEKQDALPENTADSSGGLLDQILGRSDDKDKASQSRQNQTSELSVFIKNIVEPHLIQIDTADQSELLMIVDEVISDLMRQILHHPRFQSLESAWRGAHFIVRRIETDSKLKIYLLDINKAQLAANLKNINSLTDTSIHKILNREADFSEESTPWAAICGNYTFSLNVDDVATLIRIAEISNKNETPFIAHIKPELFGFSSFDEIDSSDAWRVCQNSPEDQLWTMLRVMPESQYLGLALSHILSRLPYGENTEPTESFYFEEFTAAISHEKYLWTNPSFAVALLLAQTFQEHGWNMSQNFLQHIDGLPLHSYQENDETKIKACSEIAMTQGNHETATEQGFITLISYKNTDRIQISQIQSIAYPALILKGKWSNY